MITVPTTEPASFVSGDFVTWKRSLSDYPAPTYTLAYKFIGSAGTFAVSASADGSDHLIEIEGASAVGPPVVVGTDSYKAGIYEWTLAVTEVSTSRRSTLETGQITVLANPSTGVATDKRSHARKVLDAIELVLEGTASHEQAEMSIDGKSLKRRSVAELLALRTNYKAQVAAEEAKQSGYRRGRILMRL